VEANAGEAEKEVALGDKEEEGAAADDGPSEQVALSPCPPPST
jgi:hypothetical protein